MNKIIFVILAVVVVLFNACNTPEDNNRDKKETIVENKKDTVVIVKYDTITKTKIVTKVINSKEKIDSKNIKETKKIAPLPSWNNNSIKKQIILFVSEAINKESKNYIPVENRIVTFDSDGTLWPEKPTYYQIEFILYRIKQLSEKNPEIKEDKLIQTAVDHDLDLLRKKYGIKGLGRLMRIAQKDLTVENTKKITNDWYRNAKHPTKDKLFVDLIYQPMKELIEYLKQNQFKVYIVANGGVDFMRVIVKQAFDIPTENVIGSYQKMEYNSNTLTKKDEIFFISEGENKPVAIYYIIGKKPVMSVGNSDKDIPMLEWSSSSEYNNLQIIIHHTDSVREWSYDKNVNVGELDKALKEADKNNWLIMDMKKDWKYIYSYEVK